MRATARETHERWRRVHSYNCRGPYCTDKVAFFYRVGTVTLPSAVTTHRPTEFALEFGPEFWICLIDMLAM